MEAKERARELFLSGYNCAQSVAGAFADRVGLTEKQVLAASSCFGAGICSTRGMCGAVSGALMILGLKKGWYNPDSKAEAYKEGKAFIDEFTKEFTTYNCLDLLTVSKARFADTPMERTPEYYKARPCLGLVEYAAELLEKYL